MASTIAARWVILIGAILLAEGCALTQNAVWQARERDRFADVVRVEEAALDGDAVALKLRVRTGGGAVSETAVLTVPLGVDSWPEDQPVKVSPPTAEHDGRLRLKHLPAELLQPESQFPERGRSLPVQRLVVSELTELQAVLDDSDPKTTRVYAVAYRPGADVARPFWFHRDEFPFPPDWVLVAVAPPSSREPTVILDIHEGTYRRWGWYALIPLTVAADIATAPLQILAVVLVGGC